MPTKRLSSERSAYQQLILDAAQVKRLITMPTNRSQTIQPQLANNITNDFQSGNIYGTSNLGGAFAGSSATARFFEDVVMQGFTDGILVGHNFAAQSDVVVNITGGSSMTNVVHIANSGQTVSDLSLVSVSNGGSALHTIQDDLTLATVSDASVALCALGESKVIGTFTSYTRFTTSATYPSWGSGPSAPGSGSCANTGAIASNTNSSGNTLYVCNGSGGWKPL